jgi:hypothetical protein
MITAVQRDRSNTDQISAVYHFRHRGQAERVQALAQRRQQIVVGVRIERSVRPAV